MFKKSRKDSEEGIENLAASIEKSKREKTEEYDYMLLLSNHNFSETSLEKIQDIVVDIDYACIDICNINIEDFTPKCFFLLENIIKNNIHLKAIIAKDNVLSDVTIKKMLTIIQKLPHPIKLDVSNCKITATGLQSLIGGKKIAFLVRSESPSILTTRDTVDQKLETLLRSIGKNSIKEISFGGEIINAEQIRKLLSIGEMLEDRITLDLSGCNISYEDFRKIIDLKNVEKLIMHDHESLEALINKDVLKDFTTLDVLDLGWPVIWDRNDPTRSKNFFNKRELKEIDEKAELDEDCFLEEYVEDCFFEEYVSEEMGSPNFVNKELARRSNRKSFERS